MGGEQRTLAVRVFESLNNEESPLDTLISMESLPAEAISDNRGAMAGDLEQSHLFIWVFYYGVAFAAVRAEDPLAGEEWCKVTAMAAANKASRWMMTVGGRPEGEC